MTKSSAWSRGLRESERRAGPGERGAVVSVFYVLAYLGFGAPYLVEVLGSAIGLQATFALVGIAALVLAGVVATASAQFKRSISIAWPIPPATHIDSIPYVPSSAPAGR